MAEAADAATLTRKYKYFYETECPDLDHLRSLSVANRWLETEFPLADDAKDVARLSGAELEFYRFLFAFLSAADDLVNVNLGDLSELFTQKDILHYYIEQESIEVVHSRVYSAIQLLLFRNDAVARAGYVEGALGDPAVRRKVDWLERRVAAAESVAEKYVLMILIEGIFFSSSFAAIAYLRTHNLFVVTCQTNDLISRDEAVHTAASCCIFNNYLGGERPPPARIYELFREAVEIEREFIWSRAPRGSHILDVEAISAYVEYSADRLLAAIQLPPLFGTPPPGTDFPLALMTAEKHTNFFERRSTNYTGTVINDL
ncbi:ribonucleotide reductase large subunit 1 [bovine alphaherpesvirus 1]|uniref:ribonucleoside-diphosphate reductase n=5 Tax=Bovine herpesvirus 1 TaxID=10320 RepID=A0A0U2K6Y6_BHV1|nr:ribonucleotide reductase small subunit [Bovine herpesvirus type 1.1]AIQ80600.1 ribonucleotide reductase small subunit 2 [Bovine herpesvirus type 1.2 strain K22]AIQ80670.1 ribonucleotide reductase small subunit 2 [Bovine herpesvirus type 1.2 strain B589]AIQ80740.1 ribonucleotide reductase small subunit 2 [Bovine herpesvirus type 1.2 strain SM023]AIQ80810.1 ribonucleotide reductase small subunit 2 [Bovine herpesvirus type 1.2 strain SP1777]ALR87785.1 ribonucleotide reductase subunit 2 [Bovine